MNRWVQMEEVVQDASLRLWKTLEKVTPESEQRYLGLCAVHIDRQLLDLAHKFAGPQSFARNH